MNENDIQRGLELDARQITERIPVEMTQGQVDEVRQRLIQFMKDKSLTMGKVAKAIGVNVSVISQFKNKRYPGRIDTLINKLVHYMDSLSRRDRNPRNRGYVNTTIAKRIGTAIKQTEAFCETHEAKIALIIGDAGHGKSICLEQYARANKNSLYVALDSTMTSTAIFSAITKALGRDASGSLRTLIRSLEKYLSERQLTVMLDEASSLSVHKLDQLRQVITIKCNCPLIISGNNHLLGTINQSSTKRGYESLDQFRSRLTFILNLDEIAASKDGGLYTADDIRKLYEYGGIRLDSSAVKTLGRICNVAQSGRLRTCSHIVTALHMSAIVKKQACIDHKFIMAAIKELGLPVLMYLPAALIEQDAGGQSQKAAKSA